MKTKDLLKQFGLMVKDLSSTTSNNEKKDILNRWGSTYPELLKLMEYIHSDYKKYYVTSSNCKKKNELCHENYFGDLFCMLDNLHNRVWTGHEAISYVNGFVQNYSEYEDLIWKIIDRDMKCRNQEWLILKVICGYVVENLTVYDVWQLLMRMETLNSILEEATSF